MGIEMIAKSLMKNESELDLNYLKELQEMTPLEYYKKSTMEKMLIGIFLINCKYAGIIEDDLLENHHYDTKEVSYELTKENITITFSSLNDVRNFLNQSDYYVRSGQIVQGWSIQKVEKYIEVKDKSGEIIHTHHPDKYVGLY